MRQMGAGLAFAHELGLVHRDLKPANVFVLGAGEAEWVKLLDFGLAKPVVNSAGDNEVTSSSVVMGSPTFMAPEQARGEATATADIYALGVMLFRMLSGQVPFTGRTAIDVIVQHIQAPLPWLREVTPDANLPIEVELVMRRCLEKDPRARYPSVQALLFALDEAESATRRDPGPRRATLQAALSGTLPLPPPTAPVARCEGAAAPVEPALFASARPPPGRRGVLLPALVALSLAAVAFFTWRALKPAEVVPSPVAATAPVEAPAPRPEPVAAVRPVETVAPVTPRGPVVFRINSIPPGATVKVGSKLVGVTPTTFEEVADETGEATAELTLELKGYQSITFIATSPGPRFDLVQRLQKAGARPGAPRPAGAAEEDPALFIPVVMPAAPPAARTAPAGVASAGPATVPAREVAPVAPEQGLAIPLPAPRAGVVPLDELTSRPRLVLAGDPPRYNEQARVTRAEGTAVARCTVSPQGTLEQCKLLKAVPLMEDAVLASLKTRRYEPGRVGAEAVASEINVVMKIQYR
jgi:serine/threonine-protein kinase